MKMKEFSVTELIILCFTCMVIGKEIAREGMKIENKIYSDSGYLLYDVLKVWDFIFFFKFR